MVKRGDLGCVEESGRTQRDLVLGIDVENSMALPIAVFPIR